MNEPIVSKPYAMSAEYVYRKMLPYYRWQGLWMVVSFPQVAFALIYAGWYLNHYLQIAIGIWLLVSMFFQWRKDKMRLHEMLTNRTIEQTYRLTQDSFIILHSQESHSEHPWTNLVKAREQEDCFMLKRRKGAYLLLPKAAFEGDQIAKVKDLLSTKDLLK
jgi:hypothetical protein